MSVSFDEMTEAQLNHYEKNPKEFMVIKENLREDYLAMFHNHTLNGLYAPSACDFFSLMNQSLADFSIIISSKEIWVIENKNKILPDWRVEICNRIRSFEDIAVRKANSHKFIEGTEERLSFINGSYGEDIEKYIKMIDDINVYRVIL